jgi:hypothetical protein
MIVKVPNSPKSHAPRLSTLLQYLADDTNKKREDALFINGLNASIAENQSHFKEYWHGIIAPSELECRELTEHYKSDDYHYAAIQHGQKLVEKLQSELDFDKNISTAIHWRKNDDNTTSWHYHLVGLGEPNNKLEGRNGALQEVWQMSNITKDKPIVNILEHQLWIAAQNELTAVGKQHSALTKARRAAITAAIPEEKMSTRASFNEREAALIDQRFIISKKIINHYYAARNDNDSLGHQIALQNNNNGRSSALIRMADRGQNLEKIIANKKVNSKAISIKNRDTVKPICTDNRHKKTSNIRIKKTNNLAKKTTIAIKKTTKKTTRVTTSIIVTAANNSYVATKQLVNNKSTNNHTKKVVNNLIILTKAAMIDAAVVAARTITTGIRLIINKVTPLLPIPALVKKTNTDKSTVHKEVTNGKASKRTDSALVRASTRNSDDYDKEKTDLSKLPPAVYALAGMAIIAAETSVSVTKDTIMLNPIKATTAATIGGLGITNKAIGAVGKGTKTLPTGIKMPLQVAGLIPVLGNVVKIVTLTAETTLTIAAGANDQSNDAEFER